MLIADLCFHRWRFRYIKSLDNVLSLFFQSDLIVITLRAGPHNLRGFLIALGKLGKIYAGQVRLSVDTGDERFRVCLSRNSLISSRVHQYVHAITGKTTKAVAPPSHSTRRGCPDMNIHISSKYQDIEYPGPPWPPYLLQNRARSSK